MEFDSILDKIIEITEKNLSTQSEFLKAIYDMRNKFESSDRDHKDISENIKLTVANSFEIINTMKQASNEKIIKMLEESKAKIDADAVLRADIVKILGEIKTRHCAADPAKVDRIVDSYELVKKVLIIVSIGVLGIQLLFGVVSAMMNFRSPEEAKKALKETTGKLVK